MTPGRIVRTLSDELSGIAIAFQIAAQLFCKSDWQSEPSRRRAALEMIPKLLSFEELAVFTSWESHGERAQGNAVHPCGG